VNGSTVKVSPEPFDRHGSPRCECGASRLWSEAEEANGADRNLLQKIRNRVKLAV